MKGAALTVISHISCDRRQSLTYDLYSIWLFTFSDLKTIVGPKTAFGSLSALSVSVFDIHPTPPTLWVLRRVLIVAFWTWINLLPFSIDNQRQPDAIKEDRLNKPWRPMPSGRLTGTEAKRLMFVLYAITLGTCIYLGGLKQCVVLMFLGYWYNDLGGADISPLTRNFINGCGFICYSSGAMEVALRSQLPASPLLIRWFAVIGVVVFSTVHTQDMYDQAGDSLRNRRTVPLVIGDGKARWTIAVAMSFWSVFCPWFWSLSLYGYLAPVVLGYTIAYRSLTKRSVKEDKMTFRIWNVWMIMVYTLPLVKCWSR